jgi:hypothetical protein
VPRASLPASYNSGLRYVAALPSGLNFRIVALVFFCRPRVIWIPLDISVVGDGRDASGTGIGLLSGRGSIIYNDCLARKVFDLICFYFYRGAHEQSS